MKLKLKIIGIIAAVGCIWALVIRHEYYKHTEPPPEWTIVCDGQGHFGARFPHIGYVISEYRNGSGLMTSRQRAINRAWEQYKFSQGPKEPEEPVHGPWQDCE